MGTGRVGALSCLLIAIFVGGCSAEDEPTPRVPERVRLNVTSPRDAAVVRSDGVELSGRVRPATAQVQVLGDRVDVAANGTFSTRVALDVGANVVDILASSGRRRPAMAALRITRQVPVRVPGLDGASADEARDRLAALGLKPRIEQGGSILDELLPIDSVVCSTDPPAGTEVTGGTEVEVVVAKLC